MADRGLVQGKACGSANPAGNRTEIVICTVLRVLLACLAATSSAAAGGVGQASPVTPSAAELLMKYTQALNATQNFICHTESSAVNSYELPSWGAKANNEKAFERGEYRTDNKGRLHSKVYAWGFYNNRARNLSEEQAHYTMWVVGDGFAYQHIRLLRNNHTKRNGHITYRKRGTESWKDPNIRYWGYLDRDNTSALMGYFLGRPRLDETLQGAGRISVRSKPETINDSLCWVVEAETKRGDFTLWLDSEHGYHPARIHGVVGTGDDIGSPGNPYILNRTEAVTRVYKVNITRFEKIEDVWVPMEVDSDTHIVLGAEGGFSDCKVHVKRTKIALNPDHEALRSFADPMEDPALDPELRNGTKVNMNFMEEAQHVWQDGKIVEMP